MLTKQRLLYDVGDDTNMAAVKKRLELHPDLVHCTDDAGWGLLHHAAFQDACRNCELLIRRGIDPNITIQCHNDVEKQENENEGSTPLHLAAWTESLEAMSVLLDHGARSDIKNIAGNTVLHCAASRNGVQCLELLLGRRTANVNVTTPDGATPLHCAASMNHAEAIMTLIRSGANLEARTRSSGETALLLALKRKAQLAAEILILSGANVNNADNEGVKPLMVTVHEPGEERLARLLLKHGANPDTIDGDGRPALVHATLHKNLPGIKALVEAGADVNKRDKRFFISALHFAAYDDQLEIVEYLLANGASYNIRSRAGLTPLHDAARRGNDELVMLLLEKNIDSGNVPVDLTEDPDCREFLQEQGVIPKSSACHIL